MPKADCKFSAFLYRYRGYILGIIAVALVCAPPGDGTIGPLIAIPIYVVDLRSLRSRSSSALHIKYGLCSWCRVFPFRRVALGARVYGCCSGF